MRILVVEDERKLASFIERGLAAEHYAVDIAHDGGTGLARALDGGYDLLILDLMLPGRDGSAVLSELRARRQTLPILLLTARALGLAATLTIWHLMLEHEWKRALGIPRGVDTFAVIPVGWPLGRFGPVRRKPAHEVIHWQQW